MSEAPIIRLENVKKYFRSKTGFIKKQVEEKRAVDDVSFSVASGETLGLVGESGCGKSTLAKCVLGLIPITSGNIYYGSEKISGLPEAKFRKYRREIQMIFQNPYASLNPRMTIFDAIAEPLSQHKIVPREDIPNEVARLMEIVGLSASMMKKYPHEFSGGQRQRIAIARALSTRPKLLIADEPVSALDVSIQAQILNLISELRVQMSLSIVFISHNLAVVKHICDKAAVMESGKIVEYGPVKEIFYNPSSLCAKTLLNSILELKI